MSAVFLDLDGTLTDPKPGITASVIHALREMNLPAPDPDTLGWVIGPALVDSFAQLGVPDPEQALQHYRARYTKTGLFENRVYDGIPQALAEMRAAGHQLYLATAKPHVYARRITAHFGLDSHLSDQFGPELDGTRNDKGALLAFALQKLQIQAADCVMVGDRHHDLDAARMVGMKFVGVDWGYGQEDELGAADMLCCDVAELSAIVAQMASFDG